MVNTLDKQYFTFLIVLSLALKADATSHGHHGPPGHGHGGGGPGAGGGPPPDQSSREDIFMDDSSNQCGTTIQSTSGTIFSHSGRAGNHPMRVRRQLDDYGTYADNADCTVSFQAPDGMYQLEMILYTRVRGTLWSQF